jgi:hypothetical protein
MSKTESTDDELWDYYSGLPNPMWYQYIKELEEDDEENNPVVIISNRDNTGEN